MYASSMSRKWKVTRSSKVNGGAGRVAHLVGHNAILQGVGGVQVAEERILGREIDPRSQEQRCSLAVGWLLDGIETGRARELIDRAAVERCVEEDLSGPHVHLSASRACAPDRRHDSGVSESGQETVERSRQERGYPRWAFPIHPTPCD